MAEAISHKFKIVTYHGTVGSDTANAIRSTLTSNHEILRKSGDAYRTIVITTHYTMARRHGPSAQELWRAKEDRLPNSVTLRRTIFPIQDHNWPFSLRNRFGLVIYDECHILKNTDSHANISTRWLEAHKYLLASATILLAGPRDFAGYLRLQYSDEKLIPDTVYTDAGITKDTNPYVLPDGHPGRNLGSEMVVFNRWIAENTDVEQTSSWLSELYPRFVTRRTYASVMPGDETKRLGDTLPQPVVTFKICSFDNDAKGKYKKYSQPKLRLLVRRDEATNKLIWSWPIFRLLILAGNWVHGIFITEDFLGNNLREAIATDSMEFLSQWATKVLQNDPTAEDVVPRHDDPNAKMKVIAILLRGNPKLRSMLGDLAKFVFGQQEKVIIFVDYAALQIKIYHILRLLTINAKIYHSWLTLEDANAL